MDYADLPMVVSKKHIALIDPHRKCVSNKRGSAGKRIRLCKFFKSKSHASTFESVFSLNTKRGSYDGTIFRFPLRQEGSFSEISNNTCTPQMILDDLFEPLKSESAYILLFLQNVKCISLWQWTTESHEAQEVFKVLLDQNVSDNIGALHKECGSKVNLILNCLTVRVHNIPTLAITNHHWLVMQVMGTNNDELRQLQNELSESVLPWVGLATKLKKYVSLQNCKAETSEPIADCSTLVNLFEQLEGNIQKAQMPAEIWSDDDFKNTDGRAFCFLPLPEKTVMPVHIHGYFAIDDNRRSIKWPTDDAKGKKAEWNNKLLLKVAAPSYALLLACRANLIRYENTLDSLPTTNTDSITDAYSTWPLHPELKNIAIWKDLVSPTITFSCSLPILWTPADRGKWVALQEAKFLPGSCSTSTLVCSEAVIRLLIGMDVPVVSLPKSVCDTINQSEKVRAVVKQNEISPKFLRELIVKNPSHCSSLFKEDVYKVLEFVLDDLSDDTYVSLDGIPLLPLKDSNVIGFKRSESIGCPIANAEYQDSSYKYIFPDSVKSRPVLDIMYGPGADSLIIDPELPGDLSKVLCKIANTGSLQLKVASTEVVCKQLLPTSIHAWCKVKSESNVGWKWLPEKDSMPPLSWMTELWKWIASSQIKLSLLEGLPILPADYEQEGVTLIEICKTTSICRISTQFAPKARKMLSDIMKKLNILQVHETKLISWKAMEEHPDVEEYIPELSPNCEFIVIKLEKLSIEGRFQAIHELEKEEKDFLREQFSNLHTSCKKYQSCLRSIPIYCAYNDEFIPLDALNGSDKAFLPPKSISPLPGPLCPSMMLRSTLSSEEKLLKALEVRELSLPDFCTMHLIPLASEHIKQNPHSWSEGDKLIVWILKQQLPPLVLQSLSQLEIISTCNYTHKRPEEIYDPTDQHLKVLFDVKKDQGFFPHDQYSEASCRQALEQMGMKTWEALQKNDGQMSTLISDRMKSVRELDPSAQLTRGQCIIEALKYCSKEVVHMSLNGIPFLQAEPYPSSYPSWLEKKWKAASPKLYSIAELCSPDSHNHHLVGTVFFWSGF